MFINFFLAPEILAPPPAIITGFLAFISRSIAFLIEFESGSGL